MTSAEDILDDLGSLFPGESRPLPGNTPEATKAGAAPASGRPVASAGPPKLSHEETLIFTALEVGELSLDELTAATRLQPYKVSSTLTLLEMKRLVKALPGQRFVQRGTG